MSIETKMFLLRLGVVLGGIILFSFGWFASRFYGNRRLRRAETNAKEMIELAKKEVENQRKEAEISAKELLIKMRQDFERETKDRREEMTAAEKRIVQKEENLERRVDLLEKKEKDINARIETLRHNEGLIKQKGEELDKVLVEEKQRLQTISSLSQEEAKKLLLSRLDQELTQEKATLIRRMEEEVRDSADKQAREIIASTIQRCASDHAAETTVSVVSLPSDEMKGRIIGREGRNIRALEMATGVDIIIDDTPEAVTISGFDMMRREIARLALESLITDGRIHPGRIEEVVEKAKKELENKIKEEGDRAVFDLGIHAMHPELVKLIGKLKFRTSFGQNALQHSKEVATLMGLMATHLGLDYKLARRAGLLHDIGKVVGPEVEGTHAVIGANLARKFGEVPDVVKAIEAHHEEVEMGSIYGVLVCAADAISAARPGARAETLETYVKRLESLEGISNGFKGVEKSYALQAGREMRVMVYPDQVNDNEATVIARDIRKKIEETMEYPGQIKVIVIRETRAIEVAK